MGNRLSEVKGAQADSYSYYEGTNRLRAVTGSHPELFEYDDNGNTTRRIPGAANPTPPLPGPGEYTYNNAGQRTQKTAGTTTLYHYDASGNLIAETDTAGTLIKAYVWLNGRPLAMLLPGNAVYYFHTDHLGTPQKLTSSTGTVAWSADYLPFGKADVTVETVQNNLRFPGQYFDQETGNHYNGRRDYDYKIGRYLTADPIGIEGGINLYEYADSNPIIIIDPSGLDCWFIISIPSRWETRIKEKWYNEGKWQLRSVYNEGGEYPIPWLVSTCICEKTRTGKRRTEEWLRWTDFYLCKNRCSTWFDERERWSMLSQKTEKIYNTQTELLAGGLFPNESSAKISCEVKCRNLNLIK